jgi:hypothetical protein
LAFGIVRRRSDASIGSLKSLDFRPTSGQKNPLRKTTQDNGHMVDQTTPLAKLKAQAFPHSPDRHQIWNVSVRQPAAA